MTIAEETAKINKWDNQQVEESQIKQSVNPELDKFERIISELRQREIVVLMHRPTRWGYVVDAVIPSAKIVVLRMPDLSKHIKVAMRMFLDLTNRLKGDGYQVLIMPKDKMNGEQIKTFCDQISVEPALSAG